MACGSADAKVARGGKALAIKKLVVGSAVVAQFVVAVAPTEPLGATYTDGERIRSIVAIAKLGKLDARASAHWRFVVSKARTRKSLSMVIGRSRTRFPVA